MENEVDNIVEEGERVYYQFWDSGAPGAGADYESVYRLGESYAVYLSFDDPRGPYKTLIEAVQDADLNRVLGATKEIWSSELDANEIAGLLQCEESPGFSLKINGEPWKLGEDGIFVRGTKQPE